MKCHPICKSFEYYKWNVRVLTAAGFVAAIVAVRLVITFAYIVYTFLAVGTAELI